MTVPILVQTEQYAACVDASKRVRWDIDEDVLRGREFDTSHKFLPDSISGIDQLDFLSEDEAIFLSQIQGRTYANMFGLVERFINCKVLELSKFHWTGDQVALEALVRFSDEELKHQELFRRIERMIASKMPPGYKFSPEPNAVAAAVLSKSTWSVLGMTLMIELFTQTHYLKSIQPDTQSSPLFKDVFLYHWKEESQHARIDELEWVRENAGLSAGERDQAVDDMIALVGAVDGIVRVQAAEDVGCGDGTTALPLARLGADVTGIDISRNLVAAGNKRAVDQGLRRLRFHEGDACDLQGVDDNAFDLTLSVFGAMFAAKPFDVAR